MSTETLIFWLFVGAWAVVAAIFLFVIAPRIVGESVRIVRRILALVSENEWPIRIAKAEADVARVEAATAAFPALIARSEAAFSVIRASPLVPPAIALFATQVREEIANIRSAASR